MNFIKKVYFNPRKGLPWISIWLMISMSIVSIPTYFDNQLYYVFATNTSPVYFWQYFSGTFEHLIFPKWFFFAHFIGNFSVVLILGVLVEKVIGMKRFLTLSLTSGLVVLVAFHVTNSYHYSTMAGTSGIAWAFGPPAFYMMLKLLKSGNAFKLNKAFFVLIAFELFFIWIFISVASSMETIFWHVLATIVGVLWTFIHRNKLKQGTERLFSDEEEEVPRLTRSGKIGLSVLSLVPVGAVILLLMYSTGNLDRLFVEVTSISETSIEAINENGKIVIVFDGDIMENGITSTKTIFDPNVEFAVEYPEQRNTIYIIFSEPLSDDFVGSIEFRGAMFENHMQLKPFTVSIE